MAAPTSSAVSGSSSTNRTGGTKTSFVTLGRKKIHTTFPDKSEMVEEFDVKTDELLLRKFRQATAFGAIGPWQVEVGQPVQPIFMRRDTATHFEFRIRNLPYSKEVYSVTIDDATQQIVVRTSNKKYFKRIDIPDLKVVNAKLEPTALGWSHDNNTLIVSYKKPAAVIANETASKQERAKLKASSEKDGKNGNSSDVDCQKGVS